MRYDTPESAAPDLGTLLEYLISCEKAGERFVYRGQTKDWPGPLIPSLYRRSLKRARQFARSDSEFEHSLRRCGHRFVEMAPDSALQALVTHMDERPSADEYRAIMSISKNPEFASLLATSGFEAAVDRWILPERRAHVAARRHIWLPLINELHRAVVRQVGFLQPFGYLLGMTLAQQYGFASELLDFTSDLQVAAFFATRNGPHYMPERDLVQRDETAPGVIFRLPSTAGAIRHRKIDDYNYYSAPPQIHLSDVCLRFEDKSSPEMSRQWTQRLAPEEMMAMANGGISLRFLSAMTVESEIAGKKLALPDAVDRYLSLYYESGTGNVRYYRLLDLPQGTYALSRLGRQSAVAILPDELRITVREPGEYDYASFQAVEDLRGREGFTPFYFLHTEQDASVCCMAPEELWPTEGDCFRLIISRVLDPSTPQFWHADTAVPKRIDLVSAGFA